MSTPEIASILLGASELFLLVFKRSKSKNYKEDKKSLAILWSVIGFSIFAGFWLSYQHAAKIDSPYLVDAGLAFFLAGAVIRWIAILQLGNRFTVNVSIQNDHLLKSDGLYKYIRHPSYLGSLQMLAGLGLMLTNWISLAAIFLPPLITFIYRIHIEEKVLEAAFGSQYLQYKRTTWKLIPGIY